MKRAHILIEQRRYDLAIPEIKLHLSEEPEDDSALTLLSICYLNLDQNSEGLKYAEEAIGLNPYSDFAFYAVARAQLGLSNLKAAMEAINEAIEIEPEDADYFGLRALILTNKQEWKAALESCIEGLEIDPENIESNNVKALCLRKLNLTEEEAETLLESLRQNPEDPFTHANLGWSYLEKGQREKSIEHFHQALRIDPEFEWAREGVMTAMKSKNVIYRMLLKYFFWIGKKKEAHQQSLVIGLFIGYMVVLQMSYRFESLNYLIYAYIAFALSTWFNEPFFTSVMYMSKDGRLILREREKRESLVFIPLTIFSLVSLVAYIMTDDMSAFYTLFLFLGLLLGISGIATYSTKEGIQQGIAFMVFFALFSGIALLLFCIESSWAHYFFHSGLYLLIGFEIFLQRES